MLNHLSSLSFWCNNIPLLDQYEREMCENMEREMLTSVGCEQHPNAGQNLQHTGLIKAKFVLAKKNI